MTSREELRSKMTEFKRVERLETLRTYEPYHFCGPLEALIDDLVLVKKEAEAKGWFGVHVDVDHSYDDVEIYIRAWRNETDAEYNKRWEERVKQLEKAKRRKQRALELAQKKLQKTEEEERQMYEQLKRKFG